MGDGDICPSDTVIFRCTVNSTESPRLRWLCDDSDHATSRVLLCGTQDPADLYCDFKTFHVNAEGCSSDGNTITSSLSFTAALGENVTVLCSNHDNSLKKGVSALAEGMYQKFYTYQFFFTKIHNISTCSS